MLTQRQKDNWQRAFEQQMHIAERQNITTTKRFYKSQYNIAIDLFLKNKQTQPSFIFKISDFINLYKQLYRNVGMRFAKWYFRNSKKLLNKQLSITDYEVFWEERFFYFGAQVGAARALMVSNTARKTFMRIADTFLSDPEFMMLGVPQQARILRKTFNHYSQFQAERFVRTEATNAANFGTMQSALTVFPGQEMKKEWIASFDDRTRDTHAEADGQVVNYNDPFFVGGYQMQYPGEPGAPANEVINCRCSVAPFPVDDASAIDDFESIGFGMSGSSII